jgi:hypothetical protein
MVKKQTTLSLTRKKMEKKKDKQGREVYLTKGDGAGAIDHGAKWYKQPQDKAHSEVNATIRMIKARQTLRRYELATHFRYYSNFQFVGFGSSLFTTNRMSHMRVSMNVIKSCCDTATSRIGQSKPRVYLLPMEGNWEIEQQAKKLQLFLDGQMDASGTYDEAELVFRDATIYGNGALKLVSDGTQIKAERLEIDELIVDDMDAIYGKPQMIYTEHWVEEDKLMAQFPDKISEIKEAQHSYYGDSAYGTRLHFVKIVEAWRKPSKPDVKDGRHVMCLPAATLLDEEWNKSYFPIIPFCWTPPLIGFWGQGIALELEGLQLRMNDTMSMIAKSMRMFAVPRIFIDSANTVTSQIVNDISINKYSGGSPPVFLTPPAMASDVYQYLQWQYDLAFKQVGLSQLTAQSQKPEGLDSAVAMRTYQDVETQRFATVGQRWNKWFVQVAEVMIDMSRDLYMTNKKLSVKVANKRFINSINWKDVDLNEDRYLLRCFPTNLLPTTPEGKLAMIQDLGNSGVMPQDVIVDQLDLPIVNDWIEDETAPRENIKMCIYRMLEKGKYVDPDPIQNFQLAITMVSNAILKAECQDYDPKKIDLLRRFLKAVTKKVADANKPPTAAPAPPSQPVGQAPPLPAAPLAQAGSGPVSAPNQ